MQGIWKHEIFSRANLTLPSVLCAPCWSKFPVWLVETGNIQTHYAQVGWPHFDWNISLIHKCACGLGTMQSVTFISSKFKNCVSRYTSTISRILVAVNHIFGKPNKISLENQVLRMWVFFFFLSCDLLLACVHIYGGSISPACHIPFSCRCCIPCLSTR